MKKHVLAVAVLTFLVWGLTQESQGSVTAELFDAETQEQLLGTLTFEDGPEGGVVARFDIQANDVISPGEHAIHIHENADCGPADTDGDGTPEPAGAAGGHFNPTNVGHGEDDGPHVGDSAQYNYTIADDGSLAGEVSFPLASLSGENSILAGEGTSLVVHEGVDDMQTNPAGQSGPRIACAVIAPAN